MEWLWTSTLNWTLNLWSESGFRTCTSLMRSALTSTSSQCRTKCSIFTTTDASNTAYGNISFCHFKNQLQWTKQWKKTKCKNFRIVQRILCKTARITLIWEIDIQSHALIHYSNMTLKVWQTMLSLRFESFSLREFLMTESSIYAL